MKLSDDENNTLSNVLAKIPCDSKEFYQAVFQIYINTHLPEIEEKVLEIVDTATLLNERLEYGMKCLLGISKNDCICSNCRGNNDEDKDEDEDWDWDFDLLSN